MPITNPDYLLQDHILKALGAEDAGRNLRALRGVMRDIEKLRKDFDQYQQAHWKAIREVQARCCHPHRDSVSGACVICDHTEDRDVGYTG